MARPPDGSFLPLSNAKVARAWEAVRSAMIRSEARGQGCPTRQSALLWQYSRRDPTLREAMIKIAVIVLAREKLDMPPAFGNDGATLDIAGQQSDRADSGAVSETIPAAPAEIDWIANAIGIEATLHLVEGFAGRQTYIPADPGPDCVLSVWVGLDAARALAAMRGGETIKIPSLKAWRARVYRAGGMSINEIASTLGVDRSTAQRYLNPIVSHLASTPDQPA